MKRPVKNLGPSLEELLQHLREARNSHNVGMIVLLTHYELRRWASKAGEKDLAEHSFDVAHGWPYSDENDFLCQVDSVIAEAQTVLSKLDRH